VRRLRPVACRAALLLAAVAVLAACDDEPAVGPSDGTEAGTTDGDAAPDGPEVEDAALPDVAFLDQADVVDAGSGDTLDAAVESAADGLPGGVGGRGRPRPRPRALRRRAPGGRHGVARR
jgi:hypothetical protein